MRRDTPKLWLLAALPLVLANTASAAGAAQSDSASIEQKSGAPQAKAKPVRYCTKETYTGSRMSHKTCFTRDEWIAHGWDPLEK